MSGTESAIPRHPSNRKVIDQMMLWGWALGKRGGRWQQMIGAPIGATAGVTLAVCAATQHEANPTTVFLEIYRLTTSGDAEAFWEGPPDPQFWSDTVRQARDRERRRKEVEQTDALAKAAENAQRQAMLERAANRRKERLHILPDVPELPPEPKARKPRKEEAVPTSQTPGYPTIRSSAVFDVLARNDRPMNAMAIVKELGLEENALNAKVVNDRCNYLQDKGLAVRVMNGVYRASPQGHAIAARIQHDVSNTNGSQPTAAPPNPTTLVTTSLDPGAEPRVISVAIESIDDTIEAVLDLLLPNGFRAADLRFIGPWVESTKVMIAQVQRQ
jgi:hypothetical protein